MKRPCAVGPQNSDASDLHATLLNNDAKARRIHDENATAVTKSGDLGFAEGARLVVYGRLDDLEVLLRRAEDQVEIAERIEIAEIVALARQYLVALAQQRLGAAQRIGQPGVDEIAEEVGEQAVSDEIERRIASFSIG